MSILAAVFAFLLLSFANDVISKTLVKNRYSASLIMRDDYTKIDPEPVIQNGGGVQIINEQYKVIFSEGLNTLETTQLTAGQFTDFLVHSKGKGVPYNYDILYNPQGKFWLIVTFPTSIRLDFSLAYNKEIVSKDMQNVGGAFLAVVIFYLLILALFTVILSKITSLPITNPLRKLYEGTKRLREGDYSARIDLHMKNEFATLQDTFNEMAERIEKETTLRKQSDEDRRKLILDISHDLKNPLASVTGYSELCLKKAGSDDYDLTGYLQIIHKNSQRASRLLNDLFELSRVESPEFKLRPGKTDVCEYLRQTCGELLPLFDEAGFHYDFDIPEKVIYARIDPDQMSRVYHNLAENALRYNPNGTVITVKLYEEMEHIVVVFKDNGVGIPADVVKDIFKPFVRVDDSRNSQTGGTGLGLSIAHKIVQAHNGELKLITDADKGCTFIITLPKI
jgi:signal transduction histidine kinase